MPIGVVRTEILDSGATIRITFSSGAVYTIGESTLTPAQLSGTVTEIETIINSAFTTDIPTPPWIKCHVFSKGPLRLSVYAGNTPPAALTWWSQGG